MERALTVHEALNSLDDSELITRTLKGDTEAFNPIVRRYRKRIYDLIYRRVHNHETAEDLCQEVFLKAWQALPNFKGKSAFYSWLYQIAINCSIDFFRRRNNEIVFASEELSYHIDDMLQMDQTQPPPDEILEKEEIGRLLYKNLRQLPSCQRRAFQLAERLPCLTPGTNRMPEPLLLSEGQPTLTQLLEPLCRLPVSGFIFLLRHKADQIQSYMETNHSKIPISFIEETEEKGLGHTVSLASDYVSEEPVLIVGGDAILNLDWTSFSQSQYSTIAVRRIIDERPYGLVELREGIVGCLIQKPRRTDLAIAGCYFIRESQLLFQCLHNLIQTGCQKHGKYQLTDALQQMIEQGVEMLVQEVELADPENSYASDNFFSTQLESFNGALQ